MTVQTFVPELWDARIQRNYEQMLVSKFFVNADYEGEIKKYGDTVHINKIGKISLKDYAKNTDMDDPEELSLDESVLKIDKAKYFNFQVDDVDAVQAAGPLMDQATAEAAYTMAYDTDKNVFSAIAKDAKAANKLTEDVNADNIYSKIVALREKLVKEGVYGPKNLAIDSSIYSLLLTNKLITNATDKGDEVVANGYVGRVAGFDVYETNNLPANTIIAASDRGTTFAQQLAEIEGYRLEKRFADGVKGLNLYGIKVTRPEAIAILKYTIKEEKAASPEA